MGECVSYRSDDRHR